MCKVMEDMRFENTKQVMEKNILSIMKNLKLTVEQAMDALSVPQAQREMYAGLVRWDHEKTCMEKEVNHDGSTGSDSHD